MVCLRRLRCPRCIGALHRAPELRCATSSCAYASGFPDVAGKPVLIGLRAQHRRSGGTASRRRCIASVTFARPAAAAPRLGRGVQQRSDRQLRDLPSRGSRLRRSLGADRRRRRPAAAAPKPSTPRPTSPGSAPISTSRPTSTCSPTDTGCLSPTRACRVCGSRRCWNT